MPRTRYDRSALEAHPAYELATIDAELQAKVDQADWPDGLLERVLRLRRNQGEIESWIESGFPTVDMLDDWSRQQEEILHSTLNVRQAGWDDNDLLVDLCTDSPETVGEWEVTVERGPNAYAQFRLQENVWVVVVEDLRVGLGMVSRSIRNGYIEGERTSIHFISGWRVRSGFRGMGISGLLMEGTGPATGPFGVSFYWYVRLDNQDRSWVRKVTDDMTERPPGWEVQTDTLTATVTHFTDPGQGRPSARVRAATRDDLDACCRLINRTHDGLDLFRPYTPEFLGDRLDQQSWGPRPSFIGHVYGWDDFAVVEVDGQPVACGGLWDRGRDLREVWRNSERGEEQVVETTALMDFGHAEGHADDMAELIGHFLATTAELDRSALTAPLEFAPEVIASCRELTTSPESRELQTMPFSSPELTTDVNVTRPYTDLAYW